MGHAAHRSVAQPGGYALTIDAMGNPRNDARANSVPPELAAFLARLLALGVDIRAVWSLGPAEARWTAFVPRHQLLAFADRRTLQRLRRSGHLHSAQVELLVVFDGDQFESAWGPNTSSGSLARCAWREETTQLAYYDESRWAHGDDTGAVLRIRRKAVLIWSPQYAAH